MKEHETMKRTMMIRNSLVLSIVLATILTCSFASAQPYVLVTMDEQVDDVTNILPPGEYLGSIHSNDAFTFGYLPLSIEGIVSSSSDHINYANGVEPGDVNMADEPEFNLPPITLPENADWIREWASPYVPSRNGRFMTWIVGRGEAGIDIYQYPRGTQPADSLYEHLNPPLWQYVFVDGDCEIQGGFYGNLQIGCSGDMYLVDNVIYDGADRETGDYDDEEMYHNLQLVSEGEIIIKNTWINGKANCAQGNSIAINGTLAALGGSVRIEDTNADWEDYQGPEPDERGIVYLKGAIFARDGINLWNNNHGGTGYNVLMRPDMRWAFIGFRFYGLNGAFPLNLNTLESPVDRVLLYEYQNGYVTGDFQCTQLILESNSKIIFTGSYDLTVYSYLENNETDSVEISYPDWVEGMEPARIIMPEYGSRVDFRNVTIGEGIELSFSAVNVEMQDCELWNTESIEFDAQEINISNLTFRDQVNIHSGDLVVTDCQFNAPAICDVWNRANISRNIFQSGLTIDGNPRNCIIDHCTITNPDGAGLFLNLFRAVNISNSIISNCVNGIVNDHWEAPVIEYSDIYGNSEGDLIDCVLGEGCLSLDPLFVDAGNGDYHLAFGSPCIDAGDPDSPNDPDGTCADMGAFPFDQPQNVASETEIPSAFELSSPYPNPFNSTTTIGYSLPAAGNVRVAVYDLSGREVARLVDGVKVAGNHEVVWTADGVASGVYMVKLEAGGVVAREKVVLVK